MLFWQVGFFSRVGRALRLWGYAIDQQAVFCLFERLPSCFLQVHLEGGKLQIDQEGRSRKFTDKVQQKTFAASSANGRAIMYVTERAVFKLIEGKGLELVEVAPGMCTVCLIGIKVLFTNSTTCAYASW